MTDDDLLWDWAKAQDFSSSQNPYLEAVERRHFRNVRPHFPLDPIDPDMIASFETARAIAATNRLGLQTVSTVLTAMVCAETFAELCVRIGPRPKPNLRVEDRVSNDDVGLLKEWRYLKAAPSMFREAAQLWMYVTSFAAMFTVPKPGKNVERIIIDGREGNQSLKKSLYCCFPLPLDIVTKLRKLGRFTGVAVDIRHEYHRLPMNPYFASFYVVGLASGLFVPAAIPMGSSWGVTMGMAATLAMIAYREPQEPDLGLRLPSDRIVSEIPLVDRSNKIVGFIWIVIDNVAVVTTKPALTKLWKARLERNAEELGLGPFKEIVPLSEQDFQFIGFTYSCQKWRHFDDRIQRWESRHKTRSGTVLEIQQMVGVLVWDTRVRGLHMRTMREIFLVQATALRGEHLTADDWALLNARWEDLLKNPWEQHLPVEWPPNTGYETVYYLATDASKTRWSYLELVAGSVKTVDGKPWNPSGVFDVSMMEYGIYYKELNAFTRALLDLAVQGRRRCKIVCALDNRAVIGAVLKLLGPVLVWKVLDELEELVLEHEWSLELRWIDSESNAAHSATHEEALEEFRIRKTWEILSTSRDTLMKRARNE